MTANESGVEMVQAEQVSPRTLEITDVWVEKSEPLWHIHNFDRLRKEASFHFGTSPTSEFWVPTRLSDIRDVFQRPGEFSSHCGGPHLPKPDYQWIPIMLDPPVHKAWRQLLIPLFTPAAVRQLEPTIRARFAEIVREVKPRGECDFVKDVAAPFPNVLFMEWMGMPVADAPLFSKWMHDLNQTPPSEMEAKIGALTAMSAYFSELIAERRADPRNDIITTALGWEIDGRPVTDGECESLFTLLALAGLDTVVQQMCYTWRHLATHDDDRQRIVRDPSLIPLANEEFLRFFAFVTPVRRALADTEISGCPVKKGQVVWAPLGIANHDADEFPEPEEIILDRQPNRHIAFGAGIHRCIGAHLGRLELEIALAEWHQHIPDYRVKPGIEYTEHGMGLIGLDNLSLEWDV